MEVEWQLLGELADANRTTFASITCSQNEFRVVLHESPAWIEMGSERRVESEHALRYVYPRYYPTLPLEGYFVRPILHINVDPVTGFICLWKEYRTAQTIVDAILITRAIMAWKAANQDPAHRMQEAECGTLPMPSLTIPASCRPRLFHRRGRPRITSEFDNQAVQERDFALFDTE
jgi:hypothetical protein